VLLPPPQPAFLGHLARLVAIDELAQRALHHLDKRQTIVLTQGHKTGL
jgi:hypothetical protein